MTLTFTVGRYWFKIIDKLISLLYFSASSNYQTVTFEPCTHWDTVILKLFLIGLSLTDWAKTEGIGIKGFGVWLIPKGNVVNLRAVRLKYWKALTEPRIKWCIWFHQKLVLLYSWYLNMFIMFSLFESKKNNVMTQCFLTVARHRLLSDLCK